VISTANSAEAAIGVTLDAYGTTIVPMVDVTPGNTLTPETAVLPFVFGTSTLLPADNALRMADGGRLVAYASTVTDVAHHLRQVRGNDLVMGGEGDDQLVGDDQVVHARTLTFTDATMGRAKDLTLRLMDVADDFADLVNRNFELLGERYRWEHSDQWIVDATFQVGADTLQGQGGNDVAIGDDSVLVQPTFNLPAHLAGDFERFVTGVSDAGHEIAHALFDLTDLQFDLRDEITTTTVKGKTSTTIRHHADLVLWGNDLIQGGDGMDMLIGDAFVVRTPVVHMTAPTQPVVKHGDDAWHDTDWRDDWDRWHGNEAWRHQYHRHSDYSRAQVKMGADTIEGGSGNDLVYGDSLAVLDFSVTRGASISNKDWNTVTDNAYDGASRIAILTDTADYWGHLNGGKDEEYHDDWNHGWPYRADLKFDHGDDIRGGDGDDILFGQAGDDKLQGENGDDWLVGGSGNDTLATGLGKRNDHQGSNNASALRYLVGAKLVNWDRSFDGYGLPYQPFGQTGVLKKGVSSHMDDFSFLTPMD
jgi:hypothetical protein